MSIIEKIENQDAELVKSAYLELIAAYMQPAFGAMTKRDLDILLFTNLQKLGAFNRNPEIYDLVSQLKVTRAKARNLLYESKLRQTTEQEMDDELKAVLVNPNFLKEKDKICVELGNPFLIDYMRSKLKKLGYITDSSFSPELVKLTAEAYIALFEALLPETSKSAVVEKFVKADVITDKSFKGVMRSALKKLGEKVADKAGGAIAESISDYLSPLISGSCKKLVELFTDEKSVG